MVNQFFNTFKRKHSDPAASPHQQPHSPPVDQHTCERLWEQAKRQAQEQPGACDLRRASAIYKSLYDQAVARKQSPAAADEHAWAAINAAK